jgi:hypothetical protein
MISDGRGSSFVNTDGTFNAWTLVETEDFAEQLTALGELERLDEVLRVITWALATCPEDYPIIPGTQRLRVAKTNYVEWAGGIVEALRIWFIIEKDQTVLLLAIEKIPDIDEDFYSDDESDDS